MLNCCFSMGSCFLRINWGGFIRILLLSLLRCPFLFFEFLWIFSFYLRFGFFNLLVFLLFTVVFRMLTIFLVFFRL